MGIPRYADNVQLRSLPASRGDYEIRRKGIPVITGAMISPALDRSEDGGEDVLTIASDKVAVGYQEGRPLREAFESW